MQGYGYGQNPNSIYAGRGPSNIGMQIPQNQNQNKGYAGYANSSLGMMMNNSFAGGVQPTGANVQQITQEKERQVQQLKSQYPDVQTKNINYKGQPVDLVDVSLKIQSSEAPLVVPLSFLVDARFPVSAPKIFVRAKLKHNLFEIKDQITELDVNNVIQWVPQQTSLTQVVNKLKTVLEKDPPKQEKIIEDVNKLLSVITDQSFKDIVNTNPMYGRSLEDLKQLEGVSFQELICSSAEYKKIGQNLLDVIAFNEKTANALLQKKDDLEMHKQQLLMVSDQIETLTREYNNRTQQCKGFKEAFSKQNIEGFVNNEIKNLDAKSLDLEGYAQNCQGNIFEVLQQYLDTRKNFHKLNIVKHKLPELKYQ